MNMLRALIVAAAFLFPAYAHAVSNDNAAIVESCKHQMRGQSPYLLQQCVEQNEWAFSGLQLEKQIAPQDYNRSVVWCVAHQPVDTDYVFILACVSVQLHHEIYHGVIPQRE